MKKTNFILPALLAISIAVNVYFFSLIVDWQEAWAEQILTTSLVERLYTKSGADVTFSSVKNLVEKELGEYEIVPAGNEIKLWSVSDEESILIDGTLLLFDNGVYSGSTANLPSHLVHWRFGQE